MSLAVPCASSERETGTFQQERGKERAEAAVPAGSHGDGDGDGGGQAGFAREMRTTSVVGSTGLGLPLLHQKCCKNSRYPPPLIQHLERTKIHI